jgi:prevent-host-death family protein
MKVKVGELKTHLSSYLRKVEADGETLEVCVRERPVAYLIPAPKEGEGSPETAGSAGSLSTRLKAQGLLVHGSPVVPIKGKLPVPRLAGDHRSDVDSVAEMRGERDW